MRFLKYLYEEYYKSVKPAYTSKDAYEVFVKPSMKELKDIDTEYRKTYKENLMGMNMAKVEQLAKKLQSTIRFIFFPYEGDFPTDKWFAASSELLHDSFAVGGNSVQIRCIGYVSNNKVIIRVLSRNEKNREIVKHIMDKSNLNYELE